METRNLFRKKERKSTSKFETEWDHQQPNRFMYRTTYEANVKSSVVEKEIKVMRAQRSPLISANRTQGNEVNSDETANVQRTAEHSRHPSLMSLPNESLTEINGISFPSANFNEQESNGERERVTRSSDYNQLPEDLQNSSDLCYLNGEPTASAGESGSFEKFIHPKLNFNDEKHYNLSSNADHSSQNLSNDFSLLRIYNNISTDTKENDLAGGDHAQPEIKDRTSVFDNEIDKREISPSSEEIVYLERSADNDNFQYKLFNMSNESLKDSNNNSPLRLQRQMFIDKESISSSSNSFNCQKTSAKHDWISNSPADSETENYSMDFAGLNFKLVDSKQGERISEEYLPIQKTLFKSCKNPYKKTERDNSNYYRSEISSDTDFSLQNKSLSSEDSSISTCLNNELNTEQKELPRDPLCGHKNIASNNAFKKNFSHQDNIDSVSSETSRNSKPDEYYVNKIYSTMNYTTCELTTDADISHSSLTCDSHKKLKRAYLPYEQINFQFSDSSEGSGSAGFDIEKSQTQISFTKLNAKSSSNNQRDLGSATAPSDESCSRTVDTEHESIKSNTYHSDVDTDQWKTSVSSLVEYFENLNSETKIGGEKVKSDPLIQIKFKCNGTEEENQNSLGPSKNKVELHEIDSINKGCLNNDKNVMDYENTLNKRLHFGNDCQSNSIDLMHHKENRDPEKCHPADSNYKNKEDLKDRVEFGICYEHKFIEPFPKCNIHLTQSQLLNLKTKHSKESAELKAESNSLWENNEKLASDLLQRKGLNPDSSDDFQHEGKEAYSSKQNSVSERVRDGSSEVHKERCICYRSDYSDIVLEPSKENSVEQKEPFSDSQPAGTMITSCENQNHQESQPVGNLETRKECTGSCSVPHPVSKRKLWNSNPVYDNPHRMNLNRQTNPSRVNEVNISRPASNGSCTVCHLSKQAMNSNRNHSDFLVGSSYSQEASDKAVNPGLVNKCTKNKVSKSNQTTFFSRRRVMAILTVSIVFVYALSDWESFLKYFE